MPPSSFAGVCGWKLPFALPRIENGENKYRNRCQSLDLKEKSWKIVEIQEE